MVTTKALIGLGVLVAAALVWAMVSPLLGLRAEQMTSPAAVSAPR